MVNTITKLFKLDEVRKNMTIKQEKTVLIAYILELAKFKYIENVMVQQTKKKRR